MFVWTFLLRITHTIISQSSADSSWITLYIYLFIYLFIFVQVTKQSPFGRDKILVTFIIFISVHSNKSLYTRMHSLSLSPLILRLHAFLLFIRLNKIEYICNFSENTSLSAKFVSKINYILILDLSHALQSSPLRQFAVSVFTSLRTVQSVQHSIRQPTI